MNEQQVEGQVVFEQRVACPCGARGACSVPSGDVSMMLCLACVDALTVGDEVADPATAFVTADAITTGDRNPGDVGDAEN